VAEADDVGMNPAQNAVGSLSFIRKIGFAHQGVVFDESEAVSFIVQGIPVLELPDKAVSGDYDYQVISEFIGIFKKIFMPGMDAVKGSEDQYVFHEELVPYVNP